MTTELQAAANEILSSNPICTCKTIGICQDEAIANLYRALEAERAKVKKLRDALIDVQGLLNCVSAAEYEYNSDNIDNAECVIRRVLKETAEDVSPKGGE